MSCKEKKSPCRECDNGCLDFPQGGCVEYSGPTTLFLKIPAGLNINDIIQGLDSALNQLQNQVDSGLTEVNTQSTITIDLTGDGKNESIKGSVKLSSQAGQALQVLGDGLYVSNGSLTPGNATFTDDYFDL